MQLHSLSNEEMILRLAELKIEGLHLLNRDQLLHLYEKHILPKPSRRTVRNQSSWTAEISPQTLSSDLRKLNLPDSRSKNGERKRITANDDNLTQQNKSKVVRMDHDGPSTFGSVQVPNKLKRPAVEDVEQKHQSQSKRQKITWP